jgi:serine O-acetyltransferase
MKYLTTLLNDLKTAYKKDPALKPGIGTLEILLYQGLWAIWSHRIAHKLYKLNIPFIPRLISQIIRTITLIEIHPGAEIGHNFFIDHGAGVVIGETAEIGDNVMIYHGVTLGGHGWWVDEKSSKRHPTVEDNVVLGVGATILGPITIGKNSKIGANAIVLNDIESDSIVVSELSNYIVYKGKKVNKFETNQTPDPKWFAAKS